MTPPPSSAPILTTTAWSEDAASSTGMYDGPRAITATIRRKIVSDKALSASAKQVDVTTAGSKVTLRGMVQSYEEKVAVESYAMQTSGVTVVDSQIHVRR